MKASLKNMRRGECSPHETLRWAERRGDVETMDIVGAEMFAEKLMPRKVLRWAEVTDRAFEAAMSLARIPGSDGLRMAEWSKRLSKPELALLLKEVETLDWKHFLKVEGRKPRRIAGLLLSQFGRRTENEFVEAVGLALMGQSHKRWDRIGVIANYDALTLPQLEVLDEALKDWDWGRRVARDDFLRWTTALIICRVVRASSHNIYYGKKTRALYVRPKMRGVWWWLVKSQFMKNIVSLNFEGGEVGVEGAKLLAESKYLSNVRHLEIPLNYIKKEGLEAIMNSPYLQDLETLDLSANLLGPESIKMLVNSEFASKLKVLRLCANRPKSEGAKAIRNSPHLGNLETLDLRSCALKKRGVGHISRAKGLGSLRDLRLVGSAVCDKGLATIAANSSFKGLHVLKLSETEVSVAGIEALLKSDHLCELEHLDVDKNGIDDVALCWVLDDLVWDGSRAVLEIHTERSSYVWRIWGPDFE